jgi:hypothetical protein
MHQALLDDLVRSLECRGDIALLLLPAKRHIVRPLGVNHRRVRSQRLFSVDHHRQRLVIDGNQFERVPRRVASLGDDDRDSLADIADFIDGQDVMFGNSQRRVVGRGRYRADLILELGTGKGCDDSVKAPRGGGIDGNDARMRVGATQYRDVKHARQFHVVDILAEPADEFRVFAPFYPGANKFTDRHKSILGRPACRPSQRADT